MTIHAQINTAATTAATKNIDHARSKMRLVGVFRFVFQIIIAPLHAVVNCFPRKNSKKPQYFGQKRRLGHGVPQHPVRPSSIAPLSPCRRCRRRGRRRTARSSGIPQ